MAETPKKTARDLSDLKARLGLAKQPGGGPPPTGEQPAVAPQAAVQPAAQPRPFAAAPQPQPYVPVVQQPLVPPPGVVPPPGMVPPGYPVAQPPADPRRDPFARTAPMMMAQPMAQAIVDRGPAIEIPQERKRHGKLMFALLITALIPLAVGWACGRIYAARVLFNQSITDAGKISEGVTKLTAVNNKVTNVLADARRRNQRPTYDPKLIEDLKEVLRQFPQANAEDVKKRQDELFRTNYAMMEGIVVDRMFNYYNNTLRLMNEITAFIQKAQESEELIKTFAAEQAQADRKYGIVFAEDAGKFYTGKLVEVGNLVCADEKAQNCRAEDIKGFMVRTGASGAWAPRPGKPGGRQKITEIVIPIVPDENWRQVASGKPGYLAFQDYVTRFSNCAQIAALLAKDEKPLLQDLSKAAKRDKVFAPF